MKGLISQTLELAVVRCYRKLNQFDCHGRSDQHSTVEELADSSWMRGYSWAIMECLDMKRLTTANESILTQLI